MPPAFTVLLTEVFYRRNTYELIHQRTVRHSLCKSFSECFHSPGTIKERNTPNKFHHAFLYLGIKNTPCKHFSQVVLPQLESFIFSVLPITDIHLSESETVDQWCSINRNFPKVPTVSGAFYTRMPRSDLTSGFVSIRFLIFLGSDKTIKLFLTLETLISHRSYVCISDACWSLECFYVWEAKKISRKMERVCWLIVCFKTMPREFYNAEALQQENKQTNKGKNWTKTI